MSFVKHWILGNENVRPKFEWMEMIFVKQDADVETSILSWRKFRKDNEELGKCKEEALKLIIDSR